MLSRPTGFIVIYSNFPVLTFCPVFAGNGLFRRVLAFCRIHFVCRISDDTVGGYMYRVVQD